MKMNTDIKGFTLVELLVTISILAILASISLPISSLIHQRTKEQELRKALHDIRSAIDAYKQASDEGHIPKIEGQSGYPPSLSALVEGVVDAKSIEGNKLYFLRRLPRDPMANEYASAERTWGKRSYESPPDHPREGKDVYDVYSQSRDTGLDGIPYKEW